MVKSSRGKNEVSAGRTRCSYILCDSSSMLHLGQRKVYSVVDLPVSGWNPPSDTLLRVRVGTSLQAWVPLSVEGPPHRSEKPQDVQTYSPSGGGA